MVSIIFLFLACCFSFVVLIWAIALFRPSPHKQKYQSKSQLPQQPPAKNLEVPKRDSTHPVGQELDRYTSINSCTVASKQQFCTSSFQARIPNKKHQKYIRQSQLVLYRFQSESTSIGLPKALGMLRKMNPYAFEELLLTCCRERGWQIERNFRYTNDGGIDGRVTIAGKLYAIQAKRYRGYVNPQHIEDFYHAIQSEGAVGGFFIHTGRTGAASKDLIHHFQIHLLSGQKLVDFVLGQQLKVIGGDISYSLK